jgi:hypothetical protein
MNMQLNTLGALGIMWIALITGMFLGELGTCRPAYVVDCGLVITGFLMSAIPFSLGYFGRDTK